MTPRHSRSIRWISALVLSALLAVLSTRPAAAETRLTIQPPPEPPADAMALLQKGQKVRLPGIIVTVTGAALVIAGGPASAWSASSWRQPRGARRAPDWRYASDTGHRAPGGSRVVDFA
ncbi:MAG TPA: hypothetical protein VM347_29230 [Nonomuraea sp.]|nr:hypothetical protein [Nonomuraea sp.]